MLHFVQEDFEDRSMLNDWTVEIIDGIHVLRDQGVYRLSLIDVDYRAFRGGPRGIKYVGLCDLAEGQVQDLVNNFFRVLVREAVDKLFDAALTSAHPLHQSIQFFGAPFGF